MTHRFKLLLEFREGTTTGDRDALIDAFTNDVIDLHGLVREEVSLAERTVSIVYSFAKKLSVDAMHDVCRTIYRYLWRRRELHAIGISDRSWWPPLVGPGQPTPPDPLDPAQP